MNSSLVMGYSGTAASLQRATPVGNRMGKRRSPGQIFCFTEFGSGPSGARCPSVPVGGNQHHKRSAGEKHPMTRKCPDDICLMLFVLRGCQFSDDFSVIRQDQFALDTLRDPTF